MLPVPPGLSSFGPCAPHIGKEGEHFHFLTAAHLVHFPDPAVLQHLHDLVRQRLPYPRQGHCLFPNNKAGEGDILQPPCGLYCA